MPSYTSVGAEPSFSFSRTTKADRPTLAIRRKIAANVSFISYLPRTHKPFSPLSRAQIPHFAYDINYLFSKHGRGARRFRMRFFSATLCGIRRKTNVSPIVKKEKGGKKLPGSVAMLCQDTHIRPLRSVDTVA